MFAPEVEPFAFSPCEVPERPATGLFSYSSLHAAAEEGCEGAAAPACDSAESAHAFAQVPASVSGSGSESETGLELEFAPVPASASTSASVSIPDPADAPVSRMAAKDADSATDFGSALHRLAQLAALRGDDAARAHLDAACRTYGVGDRARLAATLERWLGSAAHARAQAYAHREPEFPFALPAADGVLEGEIDLLCFDAPPVPQGDALGGCRDASCSASEGAAQPAGSLQDVSCSASGSAAQPAGVPQSASSAAPHAASSVALRTAFIVDYKTGGSPTETDEQLRGKTDEFKARLAKGETLDDLLPRLDSLWEAGDHTAALKTLLEVRPVVDAFFDGVMVMCDDAALRANRLAMLNALGTRFARLADFAALQI